MTFSIAARCEQTGAFGVAISSSSPCVASRCAFTRAGVGAALSQNITDPRLGPQMLDLLANGRSSLEALAGTVAGTEHATWRQLLLIGKNGAPVIHTGGEALGICGQSLGEHCAAAGNLLANDTVPAAMVQAFEQASGALADRLLIALQAAVAAGGEAGPVHSMGLQVAHEVNWPVVDLRVDWSDDPMADMQRLWTEYAPQQEAYVTRALNPAQSPSYGVPGDE